MKDPPTKFNDRRSLLCWSLFARVLFVMSSNCFNEFSLNVQKVSRKLSIRRAVRPVCWAQKRRSPETFDSEGRFKSIEWPFWTDPTITARWMLVGRRITFPNLKMVSLSQEFPLVRLFFRHSPVDEKERKPCCWGGLNALLMIATCT